MSYLYSILRRSIHTAPMHLLRAYDCTTFSQDVSGHQLTIDLCWCDSDSLVLVLISLPKTSYVEYCSQHLAVSLLNFLLAVPGQYKIRWLGSYSRPGLYTQGLGLS